MEVGPENRALAPRWGRSLAGRLTVLVAAVLAIGFLTIVATADLAAESIVRMEVGSWLSTTASAYEALLSETLLDFESALDSLGADPVLRAFVEPPPGAGPQNLARCRALLVEELRRTPGIAAILVLDPVGTVRLATSDAEMGRSYASHPDLERARAGRLVSTPERASTRYVGAVWGPVVDERGRCLAVLAVQFDWTAVVRLLSGTARIGATGEVQLGQAAGTAVHYLLPGREGGIIPPVPMSAVPATAQAVKGASGFVETTDYRGVPVLVAFRPVRKASWGLVVKMDAAEAYEPVTRLRRVLAALALALLACGSAGAWLIARRVTAPILALAHTAERVRNGDLSARARVPTTDEVGVLGRCFDEMTDRLAQEAGDARRLLASMIQCMGAGVVAVDQDGRVILKNPQAERWLGAAPAELPLAAVLEGQPSRTVEMTLAPPAGGEPVNIVASAAPLIDDSGTSRGAVMVMHDITDRKRAEAALRRSEEKLRLASKMEAVGTLAAGIAHHFNNILQIILGHNEVIGDRLAPDSQLQDSVRVVERTGARAMRLVGQLLQFSRQHPPEPVVVHVGSLIEDTLEMMRSLLPEPVTIRQEVDPEAGHTECDPAELEESLINLVLNARDAMPDGGIITVRLAAVREGADRLRLEVEDTGLGISREVQARIFEPFFTTKQAGAGTGLGLSIVYAFARRLSGAVEVSSRPGAGTTVALVLPRVALADGGPDEASAPSPGRVAEVALHTSVLVVEDEATLRALLEEELTRAGCLVRVAGSAEEALALACTGEPADVLITDAVLPGLGGVELARQLEARWTRLKVLVVTGHDIAAAALEPCPPQGWRVLRKPVKLAALKSELAAILAVPSARDTMGSDQP